MLKNTCCLNSRLHLSPGDASDLAKLMHGLFLPQNLSLDGISMGKHFSVSKEEGRELLAPQQDTPWLGVWVMSWSTNGPICMRRVVWSASAVAEAAVISLLRRREEGRSLTPSVLLRGRSMLPRAIVHTCHVRN